MIGPVVSAEIALRVHVVVWRILSNISGFTGPIFAIFSPYDSALCADDESYLIFQFIVMFVVRFYRAMLC